MWYFPSCAWTLFWFLSRNETSLPTIITLIVEKLTSEIQSRENKCMAMYKKLSRWPECNALSRRLLLKKWVDAFFFGLWDQSGTFRCQYWHFYLSFEISGHKVKNYCSVFWMFKKVFDEPSSFNKEAFGL